MTTPRILPSRLKTGDKVALVSPASPPSASLLRVGKKRLEELGFRVAIGKHAADERGYLAGSDRDRLEDLEDAFHDPDVKAIFCSRGGYGVSRLIGRFDFDLARRHPKILVGFSDITVLHLALQKAGVVSFWGPMPCTDLGWTPFSVRALERVLMCGMPAGPTPFGRRRPATTLRAGAARGALTGGTLSLVTATLCTAYEVETTGRIVFLEDVDEEPYRIDRMLTHLIAAGKLSDAAGIVLGIFTGTTPRHSPGRRSLTVHDVFADHLLPLKIPVLANLAVGHVRDQVTLPYGVEARMDAGARTIDLLQAGVA